MEIDQNMKSSRIKIKIKDNSRDNPDEQNLSLAASKFMFNFQHCTQFLSYHDLNFRFIFYPFSFFLPQFTPYLTLIFVWKSIPCSSF